MAIASYDGTFEIKGVIPGSYMLIATVRSNVRGFVEAKRGRVLLEVGASDVNGVAIPLLPTFELRGTVSFEEREIKNDGFFSVVELKNEVPTPGSPAEFVAAFNGSQEFTVEGILEGDYQVRLTNLSEGVYVKSIRYGGDDVLNGSLHLDGRAADRLDVVLATNPGTLTGTVVSRNGESLANAAVALVPDAAHRQRADLYRSAYTDDAGRFQLKGIPPGDYSAFAWEDIEEGLWRDPDFIRRSEAAGKPVRVVEGGGVNIQVVAIPFAF
jgi:hypothetical protein